MACQLEYVGPGVPVVTSLERAWHIICQGWWRLLTSPHIFTLKYREIKVLERNSGYTASCAIVRLGVSLWHRQQRLTYFAGRDKEENDGPVNLCGHTTPQHRFRWSWWSRFPNRCQEWQIMLSQTKYHTRSCREPERSHNSTDTCPDRPCLVLPLTAVWSSASCLVSQSLGALWETEVKYSPLNMERTNWASY